KAPEKPSATTAQPAVKLNPYVRLAERLYREGQADAVLIAVRSVGGSTDLDNKSLAQLAVLEGMLQVDQSEDQAARAAFQRAFTLDYDVALPSNPSSKALQLFQATQSEYRKTHARPIPPKPPEPDPLADAWKWGLLGGGAVGATAGVVVLVGNNSQES